MQKKIFNENNLKYYAANLALLGVNSFFKARLFEYFEYDIVSYWHCDINDLKDFSAQFPDVKISKTFLDKKSKINPEKELDEATKKGYKLLTFEDDNYPELLKQIPDYPLSLYYQGDLNSINLNKTLAVVGSRKASENAKISLSNIISQMQNTDITIVSGLAYGIDAVAHKASIENNIKTIGVIGSGLDFNYPSVNKDLYEKMKQGAGVIFSEFSPKTSPMSQNFPLRNRIVTGLSLGTLVAEAALKSGAMISANLTLEQNRELMAMPGLISNPNCDGIYHILKNGAHLITSAQDIYDVFNWELKEYKNEIVLEGVEKTIYDVIKIEPIIFDTLCSKVGIEANELMACLTQMELRGLIKQLNTKYYVN